MPNFKTCQNWNTIFFSFSVFRLQMRTVLMIVYNGVDHDVVTAILQRVTDERFSSAVILLTCCLLLILEKKLFFEIHNNLYSGEHI
jgi:DMSO/TMAO reductase YedYZ heme-binding membrane subunit